jgi:hypothetical protein
MAESQTQEPTYTQLSGQCLELAHTNVQLAARMLHDALTSVRKKRGEIEPRDKVAMVDMEIGLQALATDLAVVAEMLGGALPPKPKREADVPAQAPQSEYVDDEPNPSSMWTCAGCGRRHVVPGETTVAWYKEKTWAPPCLLKSLRNSGQAGEFAVADDWAVKYGLPVSGDIKTDKCWVVRDDFGMDDPYWMTVIVTAVDIEAATVTAVSAAILIGEEATHTVRLGDFLFEYRPAEKSELEELGISEEASDGSE